MTVHDPFSEFVQRKDWYGLRALACSNLGNSPKSLQPNFYLALSHLKLSEPEEALQILTHAMTLAPDNRWGLLMLCEAVRALRRKDILPDFLDRYFDHLIEDEQILDVAVDSLAESGNFEAAIHWNARRRSGTEHLTPSRNALVVQTFVKSDTLDQLFESLCQADGTEDFDLFVIQDSIVCSKKFAGFTEQLSTVRSVIARWLPALSENFGMVTTKFLTENRGTTATLKLALDLVSNTYERFIFAEDDCVFSKNALLWMTAATSRLSASGPFFVGGESIFFDSKGEAVGEEVFRNLDTVSRLPDFRNSYLCERFVPSSCFATTSSNWKITSAVRGFPRGDKHLTDFLRTINADKVCILPIVPRVKDVGMQHTYGYSVAHHGVSGVPSIKTTILLSDGQFDNDELVELPRDSKALRQLSFRPKVATR